MDAPKFSQYLELIWSVVLLIVDAICLAFSNLIPSSLKRKKNIANEVVLITGGNSGYGELMSVKFAQLGCKVVIWAMSERKCIETVARVEREVKGAHKVHYYVVDVSDRAQVYATAEKVKMDVGEVTILVNNAGIGQSTYFLETPDAELEKLVNVNTMAHFWTLKAFLPNMMKNNHGHLVTVSSGAGLVPIQKATSYSASKHGANGFMDAITMELIECGKTNVKTTVVCPTFTMTPLFDECEYDGLLPMLSTEEVVDAIVEGVLTNKEYVYVPRSLILLVILFRIATKDVLWKIGKSLAGESLFETAKVRKSVFDNQREEGLKEGALKE